MDHRHMSAVFTLLYLRVIPQVQHPTSMILNSLLNIYCLVPVVISLTCLANRSISISNPYYVVSAGNCALIIVRSGFVHYALAQCKRPVHSGKMAVITYGTGVWKIGDIKGSKAMPQAYEVGKGIGRV